MNFRNRFPSWAQLAPVYAVTIVILCGWSIMHFIWRLTSFLYYLTPAEIALIFCYLIAVNVVESLLTILVPIALSVILPLKWFREHFVTSGVVVVTAGLVYVMQIAPRVEPDMLFPYAYFQWTPLVLALILAASILLGQIKFLTKIVDEIADRFVIFLYIFVPVGLLSVVIVLFRNIF